MIDALPPEQRSRVTVINDFAEEDKPQILAATDVFAHPSGNESFGIAFVEAWACGKPVIGARVGSIPSVVDEHENGLLFDYLDPRDLARAILALLDDPERQRTLGRAGREKVLNNYTWDIITDRLRDVYAGLLSNYQKR
jgi:glycosyltransferase involved in cell wall biosynthesis